jgi:hypothetical protein
MPGASALPAGRSEESKAVTVFPPEQSGLGQAARRRLPSASKAAHASLLESHPVTRTMQRDGSRVIVRCDRWDERMDLSSWEHERSAIVPIKYDKRSRM